MDRAKHSARQARPEWEVTKNNKERWSWGAATQTDLQTQRRLPVAATSLSMGASAVGRLALSCTVLIICMPQCFPQHIAYSRRSGNN